MIAVEAFHLPPTKLIPNSPWPLLHYRNVLTEDSQRVPTTVDDIFSQNGWQTQWIFRFGVADTSEDMNENTDGSAWEEGGIELQVKAGDVVVIPAGVAHKTYKAEPPAEFVLLTPGDPHHTTASDLKDIELSGFTMIGAYPKDGSRWDFPVGGEHVGDFDKIWTVPVPPKDPVLGESKEGICGRWVQSS